MVIEEEIINNWFIDINIRKFIIHINAFLSASSKHIVILSDEFFEFSKTEQDQIILFLSLYFRIDKDIDSNICVLNNHDTLRRIFSNNKF